MLWTPAGGGVVVLLSLAILGFGQGLHLEVGKKGKHKADGSVNLVRQKREWIIPPVSIYEEQDNSYKNPIAKIQSDILLDTSLRIRYKITGKGVTEPPLGIFIINERTGELNVTGIVDREEIPMFFLKGYAMDQYGNNVEPPIDLRVKVIDINDNSPIFTQEVFVATVEELSPKDTLIMMLNATDADEPNTINTLLAYKLVSQEGQPRYFEVISNGEVRTVVGTLDREQQSSYTMQVQVTDKNGDSNGGLSHTATLKIKVKDVNDNIPKLEKEQYEGSVEENVANVEVLRMKVFDDDEVFTDNWLADFTILSGNEDNYFEIITDPHTNEGVLMLVKEADYEVLQNAELSVIVSNKAEYHSSVKSLISGGGGGGGGGAGAAGGGGGGGGGAGGKAFPIKVKVKNVREGPVFKPRRKILAVNEGKTVANTVIGSYQAFDADTGKIAEHVKYAKDFDPDNWFTIDPTTAEIKLIKIPDRESEFLVNGTYIAKILAISEDLPGKTATGTIAIEVEDVNDNCPVLVNPLQTVCDDSPFITLTAEDRDAYPNGAPFKFVVVDEPPGNSKVWSIGKSDNVSAQLIPKNIYVGLHAVQVLITDNQGMSCPEKQILTLTVCSCANDISACDPVRLSDNSIGLGGGAVGLMILACLLLLLVPLLLLLCYCGSGGGGFIAVPDGPEESILIQNKEGASPEDTAIPVHAIGGIGFAGSAAGAGAGAGIIKGGGYGGGYEYNSKAMYNSMMLDRQYEESGGMLTAAEIASGGAAGIGMRSIGGIGAAVVSGAGGQVSFGSTGSQAALNEEFIKGFFCDRAMAFADEDLIQVPKDCILIYSNEGAGSHAGSVGCCSLIESDFEDNYLDDLGLKFKALADICQGGNIENVEISKYKSYEELGQGSSRSEAISYGVTQDQEHGYSMENSYTLSGSQNQLLDAKTVQNVVAEESFVSSRYAPKPSMRSNVLVTEKSYTTVPAVIREPVQNVLVTERIIRPANSLHNILDISGGENVMVTKRVLQSDQGLSDLVSVGEPLDSKYVMVTERHLGPSSNLKAAVSVPDFSMGQNVLVTERHYTPISTINGNLVIPTELSGGQNVLNESISYLDGGQGHNHYTSSSSAGKSGKRVKISENVVIPTELSGGQGLVQESISILGNGVQGHAHHNQGAYLVEELQPSNNTVGKSTNRVTKYSTVQYTRS